MGRFPLQEEQLMHRFYADPELSTEETAILTTEDAKHALTVLRLKTGSRIEIILSCRRWEAEISCADSHHVSARILSPLPSTEPCLSITLFQGLPKADKMDLIVQKSTELGVTRIVPVCMRRCIVKSEPKDMLRKVDRWRKIAREAGKQSGRCIIPEISEPVMLHRLADSVVLPVRNVVPWEEASGLGPLAFRNASPSPPSLGILIGPEGGIEKDEIDTLRLAGFEPITLGKRILRTETAGIAAIAAFMSIYGEME